MPKLPAKIEDLFPGDVPKLHKMWTQCRPFAGVTLGGLSATASVDTTTLDVFIVLLRALRAYGWLCKPQSLLEASFQTVVDMQLGWDEAEDKLAKKTLVQLLSTVNGRVGTLDLEFDRLFSDELAGLIRDNEYFQLIDRKGFWQRVPDELWREVAIGKPYDTQESFIWTGETSLQEHMDTQFKPRARKGPGGIATGLIRLVGKMPVFIHLYFTPSQIRTFAEISKFDLNTLVRDTKDGKVEICRQSTRYHILAIVKLSDDDGHEDIRIYDDVGTEIPEFIAEALEDKMRNRKRIPHWTVESAKGPCFELFYYQLLVPEDWPVDKTNIPYKPIEFLKRKDYEEESTKSTIERESYDNGQSSTQKEPEIHNQAGLQEINPRARWSQ